MWSGADAVKLVPSPWPSLWSRPTPHDVTAVKLFGVDHVDEQATQNEFNFCSQYDMRSQPRQHFGGFAIGYNNSGEPACCVTWSKFPHVPGAPQSTNKMAKRLNGELDSSVNGNSRTILLDQQSIGCVSSELATKLKFTKQVNVGLQKKNMKLVSLDFAERERGKVIAGSVHQVESCDKLMNQQFPGYSLSSSHFAMVTYNGEVVSCSMQTISQKRWGKAMKLEVVVTSSKRKHKRQGFGTYRQWKLEDKMRQEKKAAEKTVMYLEVGYGAAGESSFRIAKDFYKSQGFSTKDEYLTSLAEEIRGLDVAPWPTDFKSWRDVVRLWRTKANEGQEVHEKVEEFLFWTQQYEESRMKDL